MPEFVLIIIAALLGLGAGYFARGIRADRAQTTRPRTAPPAEASPPPVGSDPPAGSPAPPTSPQSLAPTTLAPENPALVADFPVLDVAREVLEVADHVANPELARRLIEAVVLLPEVSAVRPGPGERFEPLLHEWSGQRITDQQPQWDTIAETLAPGAVTARGALLRPAHVIVFEPPEES
jgi:hypothetical protein